MKTALSIALVTETYPPELNGVALTVERALHHLLERGHRVGLVRPRQAADRVGMPPATSQRWPERLNRLLAHRRCTQCARWVSRLGDGESWIVLLVALVVLQGPLGAHCALHLVAVGAAGLMLYLGPAHETGKIVR